MSRDQELGTVCLGWWRHLSDRNIGQSRADLAQLKRASSVMDALIIPAVHRLNRRLDAVDHDLRACPDRLALIAMTLAQVSDHSGPSLALRMGQGDPKPLSTLRFDRLIRTRDVTGLAPQLRRALAVTGQGANVARLAQDLRWWTDATRVCWCFDYYGAPQAAPQITDLSQETEA